MTALYTHTKIECMLLIKINDKLHLCTIEEVLVQDLWIVCQEEPLLQSSSVLAINVIPRIVYSSIHNKHPNNVFQP